MRYVLDFETTTDPNDCRIWSVGKCSLKDYEFTYGYTIDFIFMNAKHRDIYYFHNLKFDGTFILIYLLEKGYKHTKERKPKDGEFTTLITDMNVFYSITVNYEGKELKFYDSYKIIPMSVAEMAKAYGLEYGKGEIDYNRNREPGYRMDENEIEYLKRDVTIVSEVLNIYFTQNLKKMTLGGNALQFYKKFFSEKEWDYYFPQLDYEIDEDIRQSYKGGISLVNKKYQGKVIGNGIVVDKNSMYPSKMKYCMLPYGKPIHFLGGYEYDKEYPLYVITIRCCFKVKENHFPFMQMKKNPIFMPNEFIEECEEDTVMCMTNVDFELFQQQYDIWNLVFISGWKFKGKIGLFDEYLNYWYEVKENASKTGNKGLYKIAKFMLNSLYGRFGISMKSQKKIPYLEDGKIKYTLGEKERKKGLYIPMACFITAYARYDLITSAQENYDRVVYMDTDSLHMIGTADPINLKLHPTKLDYWGVESYFTKAKFLRQKTYIEEIKTEKGTKLNIKCVGMVDKCKENVNFENFEVGNEFNGNLRLVSVKGGIVLEEKCFKIR